MNSSAPLDYALFQLSPRRSRCELFVSGDGGTEKLASGFLKPFLAHLEVAEQQATRADRVIKLEVERRGNGSPWFNKGTLERFVRFVSTPEVLELVGTFDAEMSQLEVARRVYSQGIGDLPADASSSDNETSSAAAADITKKELLKAIDVRLVAVKHDLTMACARASAAGFTLDNVSELLLFADRFGAHRLNEACTKFMSLCQRHPELICHQKPELIGHLHAPPSSLPTHLKAFNDRNIRSSSGSDMSIDEPEVEPSFSTKQITSSISRPHHFDKMNNSQFSQHAAAEPAPMCQQSKPIPQRLMESDLDKTMKEQTPSSTSAKTTQQTGGGSSKRLSVQDRINLFENKQKEKSTIANVISTSVGDGGTNKVAGKLEHLRLPSDISEKSVLRRWSGASDMSIDFSNSSSSCNDRKGSSSPVTLSSSANSYAQSGSKTEEETNRLKDTATSQSQLGFKDIPTRTPSFSEAQVGIFPKDRNLTEDVLSREDIPASKIESITAMEKDDRGSQAQFGASLAQAQQGRLSGQAAPLARSRSISVSSEFASLKYKEAFGSQLEEVSEEHIQVKDDTVLQNTPKIVVLGGIKKAEQKDQVSLRSQQRDLKGPGLQVKDEIDLLTKFKTFATKPDDAGAKTKNLLNSHFQLKASLCTGKGSIPKSDPPLVFQSKGRHFPGKEGKVRRKGVAASQVPVGALLVEAEEYSHLLEMKLHKQACAPDQTRKLEGRSDWKLLNQENTAPVSLGNKAKEGVTVFDPPSTSSAEHVPAIRQSKGNQELNDELQVKANELEKLFAAHKLRVRSDQISTSQRSKSIDLEVDDVPQDVDKILTDDTPDQWEENPLKGRLSNGIEIDAKLLLKMVDNRGYISNKKQGLGYFSNELRGKFYEKYMQKRDAKLKEEWGAKRSQKEAKMKAMHDSLERSQAEMKSKYAGSANRLNINRARLHEEEARCFNARSALKTKGQVLSLSSLIV